MALDTRFRRTATAALLAGVLAACGGSSPTNPSSSGGTPSAGGSTQSCRNLASAYTAAITSNAGFSASITSACAINTTTLTGTCTQSYSDSTGAASNSNTTTTSIYASIADLVDEVAVIPPLMLARSASGTTTNVSTGVVTSGSETFSYDAQRRLTRSQSSAGNVTTFSAWDASGRPTTARDVGPGYDNTRTIVYDNAARTRTTTVVNAGVVTVETFDANGNPLRQVATGGGQVSTTDFTVTSTVRICK